MYAYHIYYIFDSGCKMLFLTWNDDVKKNLTELAWN